MRRVVYYILAVTLAGCAGQRAPEGGPVDTDPPFVVSTFPPNYSTRFQGGSLSIEFNKYVDHRSAEGAIFISPSLGRLSFDWSGRTLEISYTEKLRPRTTYVVTVGTDVADLHNRNHMADAFTLAYSTGDDIDHGYISGRIFPVKEADPTLGVMILAYDVSGIRADTLNPMTTKPDYVTQTGKEGGFTLQHLALGTYRVYAVRDEYKNLLYDAGVDEFGVPAGTVTLSPSDTLATGVWMRLEKDDTAAVRLIKASATNNRHVLTEFSSEIDTSRIRSSWFRMSDTLSMRPLRIVSVIPQLPSLVKAVLVTAVQDSLATYRLQVDSLRGVNGLWINPGASSLAVPASTIADTSGPTIASLSVPDSARDVDLNPNLQLVFSDGVVRESAEGAIQLLDSSKSKVPVSLRWLTDAAVDINPLQQLQSKEMYTLQVGLRKIVGLNGRSGRDSLRWSRFQTVEEGVFSTIEGIIRDTTTLDQGGAIRLEATNVTRKDQKKYTISLNLPGPFILRDLPEGKYLLHAYRDRNGNKSYDAGRVFPYRPSERFTQYADTLKLRARWPLEGVVINFH